MKRIALLLPLFLLAMAAPAGAGHLTEDLVFTGTIAVGNPETRVAGGVTEIVSPCLGTADPLVPPGVAQGVDGFWVELPDPDIETGLSPLAGHAATLVTSAPNDVDAWFYDESCGLITPGSDPDAYSMATTDPAPNGDEAGTIPQFAKWIAVDLYLGAAASFTFTVPAAPAV